MSGGEQSGAETWGRWSGAEGSGAGCRRVLCPLRSTRSGALHFAVGALDGLVLGMGMGMVQSESGKWAGGRVESGNLGVTLVIPTSVRVPDSYPQAAVRV
jgi:hypothetical protein